MGFSACSLIFGGSNEPDLRSDKHTLKPLNELTENRWLELTPKAPPAGNQTQTPSTPLYSTILGSDPLSYDLGDVVYYHRQSESLIAMSSVCGTNRKSVNLEQSAKVLFTGIPLKSPAKFSHRIIDSTEAVEATVQTNTFLSKKSNSSERKISSQTNHSNIQSELLLKAVVIQKSACNFDFMMISRADLPQIVRAELDHDFELFLKGFHIE